MFLAFVATLALAPITYEQRTDTHYPLVHKVQCNEGSGTAFRVGPTRFLSVAHVTSKAGCRIDGYPIVIIEQDAARDFSIIESGPPKEGALKINCGGFKTMHWYWSVGYAWGLPYQTTVAVGASAFSDGRGFKTLFGRHTFIPGMSGGPVLDSAGEVVGTVNAYNPIFGLSFSRALADTSVCRNAQVAQPRTKP